MTDAGIGQSTCIGIGGDPIVGTAFLDVLQLFAADPETEAIVLIGEIGGGARRSSGLAADHLRGVPLAAFVAGSDGARGQAHGPRGGDHLGRPGNGCREGGCARGGWVPGRLVTDRAASPASHGRYRG